MKSWRITILLLAIHSFILTTVSAEVRRLGDNSFFAGITEDAFRSSAAPEVSGKMHQQNWCWAASIQMVLNYHGLYVTQEQVVTRLFGHTIDTPGRTSDVLAALSGWAPDTRGRLSRIHAQGYVLSIPPEVIVNDLARNRPLLLALKDDSAAHMMVLISAEYHVGPGGYPVIDYVTACGPDTSEAYFARSPWSEVSPVAHTLISVAIERL